MRKSLYLLASVAAICLAAGGSQAMPLAGGAVRDALDATNIVEKTAVYVFEGRRYCFYFDGWHGAGWYRCGYAFRRGLGWGGVYGWHGWEYGPAARRFGHRDGVTIHGRTTIRERDNVREGSRERHLRGGNRERSSTHEGATIRGRAEQDGTKARSGTVGRGGANLRGDTGASGSVRGRGAGGEVKGGAQMNGSSGGGAGIRGGDGGGRGGEKQQ
jgi:hypothetical protein